MMYATAPKCQPRLPDFNFYSFLKQVDLTDLVHEADATCCLIVIFRVSPADSMCDCFCFNWQTVLLNCQVFTVLVL